MYKKNGKIKKMKESEFWFLKQYIRKEFRFDYAFEQIKDI